MWGLGHEGLIIPLADMSTLSNFNQALVSAPRTDLRESLAVVLGMIVLFTHLNHCKKSEEIHWKIVTYIY